MKVIVTWKVQTKGNNEFIVQGNEIEVNNLKVCTLQFPLFPVNYWSLLWITNDCEEYKHRNRWEPTHKCFSELFQSIRDLNKNSS